MQVINRSFIPRSGGVKGEAVIACRNSLITQDLKSSGISDVLGRSSKSEAQRVIKEVKSSLSFEYTDGDIQDASHWLRYWNKITYCWISFALLVMKLRSKPFNSTDPISACLIQYLQLKSGCLELTRIIVCGSSQ